MSVYSFQAKTIDGKECKLSEFSEKVLLIVNVASQCGLTPQYAGLERLYRKYHSRGFEILAFPCNQFGAQEPGSEEEIKHFCRTRYDVTFPLFSKIEVNGPNAHPLYRHLQEQELPPEGKGPIKWNFTKFLVDRKGIPVNRFAPTVNPEAKEVEEAIQNLLHVGE
ncbi:MAG: glutathione peroxidase [Sandaracinaceae bacterium]|nr:glutathione peroxidase [Sandaracinaceae bacterium]